MLVLFKTDVQLLENDTILSIFMKSTNYMVEILLSLILSPIKYENFTF